MASMFFISIKHSNMIRISFLFLFYQVLHKTSTKYGLKLILSKTRSFDIFIIFIFF